MLVQQQFQFGGILDHAYVGTVVQQAANALPQRRIPRVEQTDGQRIHVAGSVNESASGSRMWKMEP